MRKRVFVFLAICLWTFCLFAQEHHALPTEKPMELLPGMGNLYHPIATTSPEAQRFFDQGLTLVYAFNHDDAERSFRRAAELDPKSPMPWWGIALALGPNYNSDVDAEREKAAYDAITKAQVLAAGAPPNEQAYVKALAARYSTGPKADHHQLALAYRDAMRALAKQYPDDPDAGTLYAESMMDLRPWQLWTKDGKPAEDTELIVTELETVLRQYPQHVGANHFYIHAVEASSDPQRALPSAERLATLVPDAGHLVHMPSHIYARTGDFQMAAMANAQAVKADLAYIERTGTQGSMYDMMYFTHNLHFLAQACSMEGNEKCAIEASQQMAAHVASGVKQMPMLESFLTWQPFMLARFQQWDAILALPSPDASLTMDSAAWHYARGLAYLGKGQKAQAQAELDALQQIAAKTPADMPFGLNNAKNVLAVGIDVLAGKIAAANGDGTAAVAHYRTAVAAQDQLNYDEPPGWYYPVRETLGAALLAQGDAAGAEAVFREDLLLNPRNGRSLYGLHKALEAEKRTSDAAWVKVQFDEAWAYADVQLDLAEY